MNDIVDLKQLEFEFGEDWDIFQELIHDYKECYEDLITKISTAIEANDFEALRIEGHTLKGIVANFYSAPLKETAFNLEECGKKKDMSGASEALLAFKDLNLAVLKIIDDYDATKGLAAS